MTESRSDRSALLALRPLEIAPYLRFHGWQEVRAVPGKGSVWTIGRNGDVFEILLPLNPDLADYLTRLHQALDTLSLAEERPTSEVWEDLTTSGADILRTAVQRPDADDGSLPLSDGVELVEHARELLLAGACAADRPRPYYPTAKPRRAMEYLSRLRLGQTRRGSYVVTILSRVPQSLSADLFGQVQEPFDRRATTTLARALAAVKAAAERAAATSRFDAFRSAVSEGVSANLCQALVGLAGQEDRNTALQFDFSWSPTRPVEESLPRRIRMAPDALPIIREAGRLLRETSPQEDFVLRGMVVRLNRAEGETIGGVTVVGFIEDRPRHVNVELEEAEYNIAIQAHQDRIPITCIGDLVRDGRSFVLRHPRQFALEPLETLF